MKKNLVNKVHLEGIVYDIEKLEKKVTGDRSKTPGVEFIQGTIKLAVNNDLTNIIPVYYGYVREIYSDKNPKANPNYAILNGLITGEHKTYMACKDIDEALKLRIDTSLALNDFPTKDNQGNDTFASPKRLEGGFMHITSSLNEDERERCSFELDVVLDKVYRITTKDSITGDDIETMHLHVNAFDQYNKRVLPTELIVIDIDNAKDYFEGLEVNRSPIFTTLKGSLDYTDVMIKIEEEGAFSKRVSYKPDHRRNWVVDWITTNEYPTFEDEDAKNTSITAQEYKEFQDNRNIHLAEVKDNRDKYEAEKAAKGNALNRAASAPHVSDIKKKDFGF